MLKCLQKTLLELAVLSRVSTTGVTIIYDPVGVERRD
jgi:hypothetical protein